MKKLLLTFVLSLFSVLTFAQIEGKWKTIDDETKQAKSIVEVYKNLMGNIMGKFLSY